MHEGQADLSNDVVRSLVDEQFPEWRELPLRSFNGVATVNRIFRLGDGLALRFPLVPQPPEHALAALQAEAGASQEFADVSTVSAPKPVALGEPGHGYPSPWSVQTWLPGHDAMSVDPAGSKAFAEDLADLLAALRGADTMGRRFGGTGRGGHLPDHDQWMHVCFTRSEGLLDVGRLRALWSQLRLLPHVDDDAMTHGDLTPPNLLVD